MRLAHVGLVVLAFTFGCVRLGYDPSSEAKPDKPRRDAGADGGGAADSGKADAGELEAGTGDAAVDSGARDSGAMPSDGAIVEPDDAGTTDADTLDASDGDADDDDDDDDDPPDYCPERSDALFCDGFEDPALPRWSYTVFTNGSAARSTVRAHSGNGSLRASTGAASSDNNEARYGARAFDHVRSGDLWLRYYYYLPSSTVVDPGFSSCVIAEIEEPYFGFSLVVLPSRVDIGVQGTRYPGTMAFPRDQWTCVELHVQIGAFTGIFEAFLDGALAVRSPPRDTLPTMGYTSVDVGVHYTDPTQGPVEAYVDDVVAGTARIGCE